MVRFSRTRLRPPLLVMGLVLLLMLLADARPISLPSGGYATASGLFDMPSLVVLGPVWTAWLLDREHRRERGLVQRRPPIRVVHNLAALHHHRSSRRRGASTWPRPRRLARVPARPAGAARVRRRLLRHQLAAGSRP
jgi:hypothetical protein